LILNLKTILIPDFSEVKSDVVNKKIEFFYDYFRSILVKYVKNVKGKSLLLLIGANHHTQGDLVLHGSRLTVSETVLQVGEPRSAAAEMSRKSLFQSSQLAPVRIRRTDIHSKHANLTTIKLTTPPQLLCFRKTKKKNMFSELMKPPIKPHGAW
jgi:hypothetical protein